MSALPHDRQDNFRAPLDPYGAVTHEVFNQPVELADYNLFDSDIALKEAVRREGAAWAAASLEAFGARAGSADYLEQGALANKNPPELDTHDRYGPARRSRALSSLLSRADEIGDRGGSSFVALDGPARGRACRPRRPLLHADPGRGGPRLSDHHDFRLSALP